MLSFLHSLIKGYAAEKYERNRQLMEKENKFFDQAIAEEEKKSDLNMLRMNIPNKLRQFEKEAELEKKPNKKTSEFLCFNRKGVITQLTGNTVIIDNTITFDTKGALNGDLHLGCIIEYLAYQIKDNHVKVVKIQNVVQDNWEECSENKLQEMIESLSNEKPTYYNTQVRIVHGIITNRLPSFVEVETDYGEVTLGLDDVVFNFVPKKDDTVRLACTIQVDEGYVDEHGEILEVTKVDPALIETNRRCTVERLFRDFAVLSDNAYVLKEEMPSGLMLHLGDYLVADLIECKHLKYSRRAIKCALLEKNFGQIKNSNMSTDNPNDKLAVIINGRNRFVFTKLGTKQTISFKVKNNADRMLVLKHVVVENALESQLLLMEPLQPFNLVVGGQVTLIFEIQTRFIGEFKDNYIIVFDTFKIRRHVTIIVYESPQEAEAAELRHIAAQQMTTFGRTVGQRLRYYTNRVYDINATLVPGESLITKRRFIKARLPAFEIPAEMRRILLNTERREDMQDNLEAMCPKLKEPLSFKNYVERFTALLHLEEMDFTINFRNYDRERAHFLREGEFLALDIENLSEKRPSLVLGDTVHALNPFVEPNSEDNRIFEGVVHKVLNSRILLKFNASFQQKYNGEDYRLTFHFSRFSFRKQHYGIREIVNHSGEEFLFPEDVTIREEPQLDVIFKDGDMYLNNVKLPWCATNLNLIQKRAVFNILRGEVKNMPYVIYGPPGTGKTLTLVEAALQLVKNLPDARLIIGTPSNSSADLITKRIIDSNVLEPGAFRRIVSQNQIERDLVPPELKKFCATGDIGLAEACQDNMIVAESGLKLRCQSKFLVLHRIIISTCTTMGNFLQMDLPANHFTHVLIDEAGQCSEPDTVLPIVLLSQQRSQVVLAGDPHQLQPFSVSKKAQTYGINISLLERILKRKPYDKNMKLYPDNCGYNPNVLTKLLYNYRSVPSVMNVYSKLFYDDELIATVSAYDSPEAKLLAELHLAFEAKDMGTPRTQGVFFYGINGENLQEPDSPSWYNPLEAREVFLMTILFYRHNVEPESIGILTPYAKQVKVVRGMFLSSNVAMPKIGSVEEFQGQERDIMLISTVRSTHTILSNDALLHLGFVRCSKRMNVATSRARCLMIIFGNPMLLSIDPNWRHVLVYCANNKAYFGCDLPESFLRNAQDADQNNQSASEDDDDIF